MATATAALHRIRGSSLIDAIGLALLALVVIWVVFKFAQDPTRFLNVSILGARNGAIYGLVALGYTLVYGILQLINFAHGDVFALSGLIASSVLLTVFSVTTDSGAGLVILAIGVALLVAMAFASTLNVTIEFLGYRRLRNAPRLALLITAIGMSFIVQNIALAVYDVQYQSIPRLVPNSEAFR